VKIAYFVNQYPKVTHSFIRREILALERQGFEVLRIALRGRDGALPDEEDERERQRTRYVLHQSAYCLISSLLRSLLRSPIRCLSALKLAMRMSRDSDRSLAYHIAYVAEACLIAEWLTQFGAEHLHAHFGTNSAEVAMYVRVLGGPPYSFTVHGPDEFMRPMGLDEKIRRAKFVVAISNFGRSQLFLRSAHADWNKIKVVHCGLERSLYEGATATLPGTPRLVCVGRLCQAKGQLLLVEVAGRLATRGIRFELVLAGDGPLRDDMEKLIRNYGLDGNVRITGWISGAEVRKEILAAQAMILPSFAEGLPVALMEAMALKRPVLATYVAGIPELVRPGETGWLFPAGCVDEIAKAIENCLATPTETLRAMGDAAHRIVIERHSIDTEAAKLGRFFNTPHEVPIATGSSDTSDARQV